MSDLIERDKAIAKTFCTAVDGVPKMVVFLDDIKAIPSARPKGEWASVLAELHERFDALEKEIRKASAEMSAVIREYVDKGEREREGE